MEVCEETAKDKEVLNAVEQVNTKIDYDALDAMKIKIEAMDKYSQLEILKIITATKGKINENKSGVYVNLSFLDKSILDKIESFIAYREEQEEEFKTAEYQKIEYQNSFFTEKWKTSQIGLFPISFLR